VDFWGNIIWNEIMKIVGGTQEEAAMVSGKKESLCWRAALVVRIILCVIVVSSLYQSQRSAYSVKDQLILSKIRDQLYSIKDQLILPKTSLFCQRPATLENSATDNSYQPHSTTRQRTVIISNNYQHQRKRTVFLV
jgi:hypothetical protein